MRLRLKTLVKIFFGTILLLFIAPMAYFRVMKTSKGTESPLPPRERFIARNSYHQHVHFRKDLILDGLEHDRPVQKMVQTPVPRLDSLLDGQRPVGALPVPIIHDKTNSTKPKIHKTRKKHRKASDSRKAIKKIFRKRKKIRPHQRQKSRLKRGKQKAYVEMKKKQA